MKPNPIQNLLLSVLKCVAASWLLFSVALAALAQEPPDFARVQALGQAAFSVIRAEPDGGSLFAVRILGTNQQALGTTLLPRNSNNVVQLLLTLSLIHI